MAREDMKDAMTTKRVLKMHELVFEGVVYNVQNLVSLREWCLRVHYRLMDNNRFWYEKELRDIDTKLVVTASNILAILKG